MKTTREQFVEYLVDCQGEGRESAIEVAEEYNNDLVAFLKDCGWEATDENMQEMVGFFS